MGLPYISNTIKAGEKNESNKKISDADYHVHNI